MNPSLRSARSGLRVFKVAPEGASFLNAQRLSSLWISSSLAFLIGTAGGAWGLTSNGGGSTAEFLRIAPGARAAAMGEAYGPVASGAEAVYWNPAGLAGVERPEASYSHIELLSFVHHDHIAYAHPVPLLGGTLGSAFTFYYQDSLDLVTNTNQVIGAFKPHSEAFSLAYARSFTVGENYREGDRAYFQDNWNIAGDYRPLDRGGDIWDGNLDAGLSLKVLQETLHDRKAAAFAADAGVRFRHQDVDDFALSFVLRNFGTRPRFINARESLPVEADIGASYDIQGDKRRLLAVLEAALPYYGAPFGKLGLEYSFRVGETSSMSLRTGYKTLSAPYLGFASGITAGVGLLTGKATADFSFQPIGALGEAYRFSLGWRF